VVLSWTVRIM